jgi:hypothetical protein
MLKSTFQLHNRCMLMLQRLNIGRQGIRCIPMHQSLSTYQLHNRCILMLQRLNIYQLHNQCMISILMKHKFQQDITKSIL